MNSLLGRMPLTFSWWLRRELDGATSLLDAGCGDGAMARNIAKPGQWIVGLDIDPAKLSTARSLGVHASFVVASLDRLPFRDASFDQVLSCEVIEHLAKEAALLAMNEFARVAKHRVVVTTPNGEGAEPSTADHDPHMEHKCEWSASEIESLGFSVTGLGARWAWGPQGRARRPFPVGSIATVASALVGVVFGHDPATSAGLLGVRRLDGSASDHESGRWFPLVGSKGRRRL